MGIWAILRRKKKVEDERINVALGKWKEDIKESATPEIMQLQGWYCGGKRIADLTDQLRSNTSITKLDLSFNALQDSDAKFLHQALRSNGTLKALLLANNFFGMKGASELSGLLDVTKNSEVIIEEIDVSNNFFGENGGTMFLTMLGQNSVLRRVNVAGNSMGRDNGEDVVKVLTDNNAIKKLDVRWNGFDEEKKEAMHNMVEEKVQSNGEQARITLLT